MRDSERVRAMYLELELFAMEETRDGVEEIADNAPVARAVSGGKERCSSEKQSNATERKR